MIDHLVLAGPDLDALVEWWTERSGAAPVPGGSHVGMGTANQLVGLGPHTYLELIGPDPDQPDPPRPRSFGIDELTEPTLVTWAASVDDLDAAVAAYRAAGVDPGEPWPMERARPDGALLRWRLATDLPPDAGGVVPFLIDWGVSPHPATDLEPWGRVVEMRASHPDADRLRRAVDPVAAARWTEGPIGLTAVLAGLDGRELHLGAGA